MSKMTGVESARGMAALLVVLCHTTSMMSSAKYFGELPLFGLFKFGHAGVDFFFVLSGFIIQFVHGRDVGQPDRLPYYAWRRFCRIYPTYWVVCGLLVVLYGFSPSPSGYERNMDVISASVLLIPLPLGPILGPAWTLQHEVLFYLLFAFLILSRRFGLILMAGWGIGILLNMVVPFADTFPLGFLFRLFNIGFFFGIFTAIALRRWKQAPARLLLGLGLGLFFGAGLIEDRVSALPLEWPPLHLAYSLGAAVSLYGLACLERRDGLRLPVALVQLGTASYSVYLTHVITIMAMQQLYLRVRPQLDLPPSLWFWLIVILALGVGVIFSRLIEQPILQRTRPRSAPL